MNLNNDKNTLIQSQLEYIENTIREQMSQYIGQKSSKQVEVSIANNLQTLLANFDNIYRCNVSDNVSFICETDATDQSKINVTFIPKSKLGELIIRDIQQLQPEELQTTCISKFNFILGD